MFLLFHPCFNGVLAPCFCPSFSPQELDVFLFPGHFRDVEGRDHVALGVAQRPWKVVAVRARAGWPFRYGVRPYVVPFNLQKVRNPVTQKKKNALFSCCQTHQKNKNSQESVWMHVPKNNKTNTICFKCSGSQKVHL